MTPVRTTSGAQEAPSDIAPLPPLKRGTIFLQLEERPTITYQVLKKFLSQGMQDQIQDVGAVQANKRYAGLIITRQYPPDLTKDTELSEVPIFWLTTNLRPDQKTISPSAITRLNLVMTDFIQEGKDGLAVVDCLEYIITQNSFEVVLRLIQAWNDKVVGTRKRILISVDPLTLTIQQLHLIKKECQELNIQ